MLFNSDRSTLTEFSFKWDISIWKQEKKNGRIIEEEIYFSMKYQQIMTLVLKKFQESEIQGHQLTESKTDIETCFW